MGSKRTWLSGTGLYRRRRRHGRRSKIKVQDRDGVWLEKWLTEAVEAAAGGKLSISAVIMPENWEKKGTLKTGAFELDSVDASGPPATVTISAASLAFSSDLRQTKKTKAWKNYNLSGIASEIAGSGGMGCMYESSTNPSYDRVEQTKQSDIDFSPYTRTMPEMLRVYAHKQPEAPISASLALLGVTQSITGSIQLEGGGAYEIPIASETQLGFIRRDPAKFRVNDKLRQYEKHRLSQEWE